MKNIKKLLALSLSVCLLVAFFAYPTLAAEQTSSYTLQYSTLVSWDYEIMKGYNCYAYVLGRIAFPKPGKFSTGTNETYDGSATVWQVAELVKEDLYALGYECVVIQSERPESTNYGQTAIALRMETTYTDPPANDFHFAVLKNDGWYHKPGGTAILKFNEAPSNDVTWTNERYDNDGYHEPYVIYDSEIVYILFSETHGYVEGYTGNNYHSGSSHYYEMHYGNCRNCGEKHDETKWISTSCFGPPCLLPFSDPDTPVEY